MSNKRSPQFQDVIRKSREEANRLRHDFVGTEHFLLGLLKDRDNLVVKVLESLEVDCTELKYKLEKVLQRNWPAIHQRLQSEKTYLSVNMLREYTG